MSLPTSRPLCRPASYYQRDWFLACRDARSFWSTPVAWRLAGDLDQRALAAALEHLMLRHEALRTSLHAEGSHVHQLVWPRVEISLAVTDLSGAADPAAAAESRILRESEQPRVLETPPLWHCLLLRLGPRLHMLALLVHHLIFDGWSHGVLSDELPRCYRALAAGRQPALPPLRAQFGDFAEQERAHRDPAAQDWWACQLASLPPLAPLPPVGGRFVSCPFPAIPPQAAAGLQRLAQGSGTAVALLAVLIAARRHHTGEDVVIGVTRAGRDRLGLQRVIGPVADHVPVRVNLAGALTFGELLGRVRSAYRDAMAHYLPLGLVRQCVPAAVLAARHGRIHDTRYNYLPSAAQPAPGPAGAGLQITGWPIAPTRIAPRHTEDHPEVLPLSYLVRHQRAGAGAGGEITGEVCGHDQLHGQAGLAGLAEAFTATLQRVTGGGAGGCGGPGQAPAALELT